MGTQGRRPLPETRPELLLELDPPDATEDRSGKQAISVAWEDVLEQIREASQTGDYDSVLHLGQRYLTHDPDHTAAQLYYREARVILEGQLLRVLEPLDRVVVLTRSLAELSGALELDHREGFLLSRIDGLTTIEDLLDVAGMPRLDALRLLCKWVARGVVRI